MPRDSVHYWNTGDVHLTGVVDPECPRSNEVEIDPEPFPRVCRWCSNVATRVASVHGRYGKTEYLRSCDLDHTALEAAA